MEEKAFQKIEAGITRFVLTPVLLSIITFGIYWLVWIYKIHDEMLHHTGDRSINPGKALGFMFIPIFNIFWAIYMMFYVPGLIKNMDMDDGIPMPEQTNAGLIGIIGIIPIVNLIWAPLIQNALNRHWNRHLEKLPDNSSHPKALLTEKTSGNDLKKCPSCQVFQEASKKECPNCGNDLTNVGAIPSHSKGGIS